MLSASLLNVIEDGYDKDLRMISYYEKLLKSYPIGSISIKKINKKKYCYINIRIKNKVQSKYYSNNQEEISKLKEQIKERNHYKNLLYILKSEIKDIERILKKYNNEKDRQRRQVLEFN